MRLSDLSRNASAIILRVEDSDEMLDNVQHRSAETPLDHQHQPHLEPLLKTPDTIANRLKELGFVPGESVRLITVAPFGGDPILVQIGFTRFALRRREAARILIEEIAV